ncbi:GTPase [Leptobacterium flavescens]|uniref:GTPase n=1 Tax=Leptobacterium flavescens TaxID=472055 RepID=A0A6P0UKT6_9FLAO|nr:GTPase [Leptobacterium flavescens]NER12489.1 GTPase [Leptobacterium flavescens]
MESKLIFVYNANSGRWNAYLDAAHKVLSPKTYQCNLCDITFGVFRERSEWKNFRKNSGLQMEFLHIDEFEKQYKSQTEMQFPYPVILKENADGLEPFVSADEINQLKTAEELMELLEKRTKNH